MKFESSGLGGQKSNFKFASTGLSQDSPIPGLTSSSFKIHDSSLTLGVTAAHPFWSVDREGFVPAGELRQYERVVAMDGREFRLTSITPRDGPETVYNFEVANEHVYYVGEDGLLVHNSCDKYVHIIRNKSSGVVRYIGITNNTGIRRAAHLLSDNLRRGEELVKITNKISHNKARNLESALIHRFIANGSQASASNVLSQLAGAGLRNLNRGRLASRVASKGGPDFSKLLWNNIGSSFSHLGKL